MILVKCDYCKKEIYRDKYDVSHNKNLFCNKKCRAKYQSTQYRKYNINLNYFDDINSEDKYYFLGLLCADGNLSERRITIQLHKKDIDILLEMNKYMENETPISNKNTYPKLYINNENMKNKLIQYGITECKTFTLEFPKIFINNKNVNHFIRGYFDGDGSIYKHKLKNYNKYAFGLDIMGNYNFLKIMQNILVKNCDLNFTKISKQKNIYRLRYGGNKQIKKIYHYLYDGSKIYMRRKYNIFKQILEN